jgi:hypothetical protein
VKKLHGFCLFIPVIPAGYHGKKNGGLFKNVMPVETSNNVFIKPANSLCEIRRSPGTPKKPAQVFMSGLCLA